MTAPRVALDLLRRQVADLLADIDTASLPAPDAIRRRRGKVAPGREWRPHRNWTLFTHEDADGAGVVYLDHRCDDLDYHWGEPGDWEAVTVDQARRIGLAYLAAAARADAIVPPSNGIQAPAPVLALGERRR